MASASDIKARILSVADTKKVTDAMYMISSVKMRRAKREVQKTEPYFNELKHQIKALVEAIPENTSRYFKPPVPPDGDGYHRGILMITSDKGLSGGYNRAVTKIIDEQVKLHPNILIFVIGEYGRQYLTERKIPFIKEFDYSAEYTDIKKARRICADLLEYFDNGLLDQISIIYTDYKSGRPNECKKRRLLPLEKGASGTVMKEKALDEMEFLPNPSTVLDGIIPSYLTGFIYGSLVDSYCSEQEARMTMMSTAGKNADEMIQKLKLSYNSVRQAAITREMIEISSGVRALKAKHAKKRNGSKHE